MFDVYDENVLVQVNRNGKPQLVPFYDLKDGDYIVEFNTHADGDAHPSEDPDCESWVLYTCDRDLGGLFPEDFGAALVRQATPAVIESKVLRPTHEELQNIYDVIEHALTMAGYEVIANRYSGLKVFGNGELYNYSVDIAMEAK